MTLRNRLQEIYTASGHDISCDNRRYATKTINTILTNEFVKLEMVKNGFVKTQKNGFKYNCAVRINGIGRVYYLKNFEPDTILKAMGQVIKESDLKSQPHKEGTPCTKCDGKGIIQAFLHVDEGICYDCLGLGYKFIK